MRRVVRILRMMGGAGATANARRACQELVAHRRYGDEVAARLDEATKKKHTPVRRPA